MFSPGSLNNQRVAINIVTLFYWTPTVRFVLKNCPNSVLQAYESFYRFKQVLKDIFKKIKSDPAN